MTSLCFGISWSTDTEYVAAQNQREAEAAEGRREGRTSSALGLLCWLEIALLLKVFGYNQLDVWGHGAMIIGGRFIERGLKSGGDPEA
jgi:hypothetical protein